VEQDIEQRVRRVISEKLRVDESKVRPESSLIEDLGADSLDVVELVMRLEEEFGITVPDEDLQKLMKVGDVVEYIRKKLGTGTS
jgi:acyl carrier protein